MHQLDCILSIFITQHDYVAKEEFDVCEVDKHHSSLKFKRITVLNEHTGERKLVRGLSPKKPEDPDK